MKISGNSRSAGLGGLSLFLYRAAIAGTYLRTTILQMLRWLFRSRETTNFTYDLTPLNIDYLAALITEVTGQPFNIIRGYMDELENDAQLRRHIAAATLANGGGVADPHARYGRRLGWYALVRATRPRLVVETGVDKGLGSCVLAAALLRNAAEGFPGKYVGTDINPRAGYLFSGAYGECGTIICGDSITSLEQLTGEIDLFVNDSDHSAAYEQREYEAIAGKLGPRAVIIGDNAHCTDKLLQFARMTGRSFLYFAEKPADHWYPGAGIGIAFTRRQQQLGL